MAFVFSAPCSCSRRQFEQYYCTATKFSCPFKMHMLNLIVKKYYGEQILVYFKSSFWKKNWEFYIIDRNKREMLTVA